MMMWRPYGEIVGPELRTGDLRAAFYSNGGLRELAAGHVRVNRGAGNALEGGLDRVYVRSWTGTSPTSARLVTGPRSDTHFACEDGVASWRCTTETLAIRTELSVLRQGWRRVVTVQNRAAQSQRIDLLFGQDLGLATDAALFSNEAYVAQYLDHRAAVHAQHGHVIQTRQNLAQNGAHPWLVQGVMGGARGFCTDGFDFFGRDCRVSGEPRCLGAKQLGTRVRQQEFAYVGLQSRTRVIPPGKEVSVVWFALFVADHAPVSSERDHRVLNAVLARPEWAAAPRRMEPDRAPPKGRPAGVETLISASWVEGGTVSEDELLSHFKGGWRHPERARGELLSFMHGAHAHVVLKAKERVVWRPHGWIICRAGRLLPREDVGAVTCWMAGVFASQLTMGNTVFNRLLPVVRDPLSLVRLTGVRAMVRVGRTWQWLGVPSYFVMEPHACLWFYRLGGRRDGVQVHAALDQRSGALRLGVRVKGRQRAVRLVLPLMTGEPPDLGRGEARLTSDGRLELAPDGATLMRQRHPKLRLHAKPWGSVRAKATWVDGPGTTTPVAVIWDAVVGATEWGLTLAVTGVGARGPRGPVALTPPVVRGNARAVRLGDALPWMAEQARLHAAAPRGLEQYSGGAWGARDACQGPMDLVLALGQDRAAAELLKTIFAAQQADGGWPQWFMFPPYEEIRSDHAHGDVVLWPLHALCEYVQESGDLGFLDVRVAPMGQGDGPAESVASRVKRLLGHVRRQFLPGTHLVRYGVGDWNDSLQPAHREDADRLVSSWTVALSYEVLTRYAEILSRRGAKGESDELNALAEAVRQDFHRHLMGGDVVAGFGRFDERGQCELLLHPTDRVTGIHYRLLPMIRGVLSGLFAPADARAHMELVRRELLAPDGVRLMDRPPAYRGGRMKHFQRAESAAFFGREVGLMYTHAHLRYVQALARMGEAQQAWTALAQVNPIGLHGEVARADRRQANAYFSSSDAAFSDRYTASAHYAEAKSGQVEVRGGWRVYSSGPGLFVRRVVGDLLGLRRWYGAPLLDPCVPPTCCGMQVDWEWLGRRVEAHYHVGTANGALGNIRLAGQPVAGHWMVPSPYRAPGFCLDPNPLMRKQPGAPLRLDLFVGSTSDRGIQPSGPSGMVPSHLA